MNQSIFPDRPLPQSTGRMPISDVNTDVIYQLYNERNSGLKTFSSEAVTNIHTQNDLSNLFFSEQNIEALQKAIRHYVYEQSCKKHIIGKQSDNDLKIIMRSIYLQYAEHKPFDTLNQVKALNMRVIEFCVPRIIQEINMYLYYKKDISKIPDPMSRGQFVSSKGEKVDQFKSFF